MVLAQDRTEQRVQLDLLYGNHVQQGNWHIAQESYLRAEKFLSSVHLYLET